MNNKPTFELTTAVLAMSSLVRFIAGANFKRQWTVAFTEDRPEFGMKKNAELIRVEPHIVAPYTAKAHFTINRLADGLPFGFVAPAKTLVARSILIKQILASEIVAAHGVGGKIYVGLTTNPLKTTALVAPLNELYNLGVTADDILEQDIVNGSSCIMVRFNPQSIAFAGAFLVDLYTPIDDGEAQPV